MDLGQHIQRSVTLMQKHQPPGGYFGGFSGGKDSIVIKELARIAGVQVRWVYNVTTLDPPELVRFIRQYHADVEWRRSKWGNMLHRMVLKGLPPTPGIPWCCDEFKEQRLGSRNAEESPRRPGRRRAGRGRR